MEILASHDTLIKNLDEIKPVCTRSDVLAARVAAKSVSVSNNLRQTIVDIVQATRNNPQLQFGHQPERRS
ncbi:MAG: hypothetical protein R3A13_05150 [Bdellovibrionota bacterium]